MLLYTALKEGILMRILKEVDKYIKDNGIPFKCFELNYSLFPSAFNGAVDDKLREITDAGFVLTGPSNYYLYYDENGRLFLEAKTRGSNKLLIFDDEEFASAYSFLLGHKVCEGEIHNKASVIISSMDERLKVRKTLNNIDYVRTHPIERVKAEAEIMKVFNANGETPISDSYEREVEASIQKITSYIKYLMDTYQKDLEEYYENSVLDIQFTEPETSTVIRKYKGTSTGSQDRCNDVIPLSDRIEALRRYPFKYFGRAYSNSSKDTLYYCFMYEREDGIPVMILEPASGTKHTKTIFLDRDANYSEEDFISLVREYLELPYTDYVNNKRTILHNHTNINWFNIALELAMTFNSSSKYTKKYQNGIRGYKKLGL